MNDMLKLLDKYISRKLWFGVLLPAWMLIEGHIDGDAFVIIASVAIGGMALVDFGLAVSGQLPPAWKNKNGSDEVEILERGRHTK